MEKANIKYDFSPNGGAKKSNPNEAGFFNIRTANQTIEDAKTKPIPRDLFRNLVLENQITILFGDTGLGKSIFAVQIANEISQTDKVVYFDLEMSDKQFERRYSTDFSDHYKFNDNLFRVDFVRRFKIPEGYSYDTYFIESLKEVVGKTGAKIVFIDNLVKLLSADTDHAKDALPLMNSLNDLKFDYDLTLVLLEHTRKSDSGRPISLNDLQGSKHKSNLIDSSFVIGRSARDKNMRYVKQLKTRDIETTYDADHVIVYEICKENSFLQFKFVGYDSEYNHLKQPTENDKTQQKEASIELAKQGVSNREIARQLGVSEGTIRYWLRVKNPEISHPPTQEQSKLPF